MTNKGRGGATGVDGLIGAFAARFNVSRERRKRNRRDYKRGDELRRVGRRRPRKSSPWNIGGKS